MQQHSLEARKVRIVSINIISNNLLLSLSCFIVYTDKNQKHIMSLYSFSDQEKEKLRISVEESNKNCVTKSITDINCDLDSSRWTGIKHTRMDEFIEELPSRRDSMMNEYYNLKKFMKLLNE